MDDVKSNGRGDGELKLRKARLEFRGSKKEGSEVGVGVERLGMVRVSKVSAVSGRRDAGEAKRQPLFVAVLYAVVWWCMMR